LSTHPTAPRCTVCTNPLITTEQGACLPCINQIRHHLQGIRDNHARLPDAIKTLTGITYDHNRRPADDVPVPGGDALVMLAGGTANTVTSARDGDRTHAQDNHPTDPPSLTPQLAAIEDDWRHQLGQPPADYEPTISKTIQWLTANVHTIARTNPNLAHDAETLQDLHNRTSIITGTSNAPQRTGIACFDCGGHLIQRWTDDGLDDQIVCQTCDRRYTYGAVQLARLAKIRTAPEAKPDALVTMAQAKRIFPDARPNTLDVWAHRARSTNPDTRAKAPIQVAGKARDGKPLFRIGDIHDALNRTNVAS